MTEHNIFIVAGEPSGDIHGANLIREILRMQPNVAIRGVGGERMAAAGMVLRHDLASEAIMGFAEVVRKLGQIRATFRDTINSLEKERPDLLILIDYPGFNLRLAERARKLGIRTLYYICPQVWAWGKGRIRRIARLVQKAIVILDFEERIYRDAGLDVEFVGHPLVDHIDGTPIDREFISQRAGAGRVTFGLLPGSRSQEVRRHLPIMLRSAEILGQEIRDSQFIVACADRSVMDLVQRAVQDWRDRLLRERRVCPEVEVACEKTYEVISLSDMCVVASGTATLETAYFLKPMVVIYKTTLASWLIARAVVRLRHIALANILAHNKIVPELIQFNARPERIAAEAVRLLRDDSRRRKVVEGLRTVKARLGAPGASERAARAVIELLNSPVGGAAAG